MEWVKMAIMLFGNKTLDFTGCILAGYYEAENAAIQKFDTKLKKLLTIIAKTKN